MADYTWAVPVMRAGYAGRGGTYLAVAGLSLWAIWRGGQAEGTSSAMETLSTSPWGLVVLWAIGLGLIAYALWRGIDAVEDLEDYGTQAKGLVSRAGMIVTGLIHGALGAVAIGTALGSGGSGDSGGGDGSGGGITTAVSTILGWPGGRWFLAVAAICTIGSGLYYAIKAWQAKYREKLAANRFTSNWDWALRAGVFAQAVIILIIGGFIGSAALNGNAEEAGGVGEVFDWLANQPLGKPSSWRCASVCSGLRSSAS